MNDFQKYVSQNKDRAKAVGPGVYRIPLIQEELTPSFKLNSPYMQSAENGGLYAFVDSTGNIIPNQDIEYDPSDNQYYKVHHLPDAKVEAPSLSAYNDPNYINILTGNYYGHKFVPTEQNVKYYQRLYENDHNVREGWGLYRWIPPRWNDVKWAYGNFVNDINRQVDLYVANHRRAEERNPNFNRDWDMLNNIDEGFNAMTGGIAHKANPAQLTGFIRDINRGEGPVIAWGRDNSGFFTPEYAKEHPVISTLGNLAGDILVGKMVSDVASDARYVLNKGIMPLFGYHSELPIKSNNFYRVVSGTPPIEDAIESGVIRAKTGWYHGVLDETIAKYGKYLPGYSREQLRKMDPDEVADIIKENMKTSLPTREARREAMNVDLVVRSSTNHGGTVGFSKGKVFYDPKADDIVIEGTPSNATFREGHHGKFTDNYNEDIPTGRPAVLVDEVTGEARNASHNAADFIYYDQVSNIFGDYWKKYKFPVKKKKYGGYLTI